MGFFEFVAGGYDPCVNVVLLEDLAAVAGVAIAGGAMGLSYHYGSHIPDAVGSIAIGGLLGETNLGKRSKSTFSKDGSLCRYGC